MGRKESEGWREGVRGRRNRKRRGEGRKKKGEQNMMEMIRRGGCGRQRGKGDEGREVVTCIYAQTTIHTHTDQADDEESHR